MVTTPPADIVTSPDNANSCASPLESPINIFVFASGDEVTLDTIDKIVEWAERAVCQEYEVSAIADLSFGKGYALTREKVMNTIKAFADCVDHLILIGHRKVARAIVDGKPIVEPESLDITGKLKSMIMSDCDAIGYVHRNEEEKLMVSFKASEAVEAGSRCTHLKGEVIDFDWAKIYKKGVKDANSKTKK